MFWNVESFSEIETLLDEMVPLSTLLNTDNLLQLFRGRNQKLLDHFSKPDIVEELLVLCLHDTSASYSMDKNRFRIASVACDLLTEEVDPILDILIGHLPATTTPTSATHSLLSTTNNFDCTIEEDEEEINNENHQHISTTTTITTPTSSSSSSPTTTNFLHSNHYLDILSGFLIPSPPFNALVCSFYMRIFTHLVSHRPRPMIDYLKSKPDFMTNLLTHLGTSASIADVLLSFFTKIHENNLKRDVFYWLHNVNLIPNLVDLLHSKWDDENIWTNASYCLSEIVKSIRLSIAQFEDNNHMPADLQLTILLDDIESEHLLSCLMNNVITSNTSKSLLESTLTFLQTLLDQEKNLIIQCDTHVPVEADKIEMIKKNLMIATIPNLELMFTLLRHSEKSNSNLSVGLNDSSYYSTPDASPPFGALRLTLLKLLEILMSIQNDTFESILQQHDILSYLLNLVQQYHWNSFLHHTIELIVSRILSRRCGLLSNSSSSPLQQQQHQQQQYQTSSSSYYYNQSVNMSIQEDSILNHDEHENHYSHPHINSSSSSPTLPQQLPLLHHLLVDCELVDRLLLLFRTNAEAERRHLPRRGYMGHVIRMANILRDNLQTGVNSQLLQKWWHEIPEESQMEWEIFVEGELDAINKRNQIQILQQLHRPLQYNLDVFSVLSSKPENSFSTDGDNNSPPETIFTTPSLNMIYSHDLQQQQQGDDDDEDVDDDDDDEVLLMTSRHGGKVELRQSKARELTNHSLTNGFSETKNNLNEKRRGLFVGIDKDKEEKKKKKQHNGDDDEASSEDDDEDGRLSPQGRAIVQRFRDRCLAIAKSQDVNKDNNINKREEEEEDQNTKEKEEKNDCVVISSTVMPQSYFDDNIKMVNNSEINSHIHCRNNVNATDDVDGNQLDVVN